MKERAEDIGAQTVKTERMRIWQFIVIRWVICRKKERRQ